jgi:ethanolamine utilization protein EutN
MHLARVTGTLWATRKIENSEGAVLQVVQPLDDDLTPLGKPIVAADTVGAGPGELVFYVTAYEAVIPFVTRRGGPGLGTLVPVDASIVGIVERWERSEGYRSKGGSRSEGLAGAQRRRTDGK